MLKWFKTWLIKQLFEISAWIAVAIMILSILHIPYQWFFMVGVLLLIADEDHLKDFLNTVAPDLQSKIDK